MLFMLILLLVLAVDIIAVCVEDFIILLILSVLDQSFAWRSVLSCRIYFQPFHPPVILKHQLHI